MPIAPISSPDLGSALLPRAAAAPALCRAQPRLPRARTLPLPAPRPHRPGDVPSPPHNIPPGAWRASRMPRGAPGSVGPDADQPRSLAAVTPRAPSHCSPGHPKSWGLLAERQHQSGAPPAPLCAAPRGPRGQHRAAGHWDGDGAGRSHSPTALPTPLCSQQHPRGRLLFESSRAGSPAPVPNGLTSNFLC